MSEAIIVAIITGGITLIGTGLSNWFTHSKTLYRLDLLERKMEKHNNFIERVYICEGKISALEDKQRDLEGDLDGMRRSAIS